MSKHEELTIQAFALEAMARLAGASKAKEVAELFEKKGAETRAELEKLAPPKPDKPPAA